MDKKEIIRKFTEFNRFAKELFELRFVEKLKGSGYTIHAKKGEPPIAKLRGPDDEEIKAFVNDIRRFFQKGEDRLKFQKLMPYYLSGLIEESEKKIFNKVMSDYDSFNKRKSGHSINGKELTIKEILDVFLYGKVSHRTDGISEIHDQWEQGIPAMYISLKFEFIMILQSYLKLINNIVYANNQVLKKLKTE